MVESAVQAPIANLIYNYAVTERVGNVEVHPHFGLLPGLLWVE